MGIGTIVNQQIPHAGNPRNSEGAFLTLKDGRILFVFSRYCGDTWLDHASADLAAITSADGGQTWSEPKVIFTCAEAGVRNLMSVSLQSASASTRLSPLMLRPEPLPTPSFEKEIISEGR